MLPAISIFREIEAVEIDLATLILDPELQPRVDSDDATITEYVAAMERATKRGEKFTAPLYAVETASGDLLLIDGWHRVAAARKLGWDRFPAKIVSGSRDVAIQLAAQCNARHGKRRTPADLAKVIAMLTALAAWRQATDGSIGNYIGASRQAVQRARTYLAHFEQDANKPLETLEVDAQPAAEPPPEPDNRRTVHRGGQDYTITTGKMGKRQRPEAEPESEIEPESDPKPLSRAAEKRQERIEENERVIRERGVVELRERYDKGRMDDIAAARIARMPEEDQRQEVARLKALSKPEEANARTLTLIHALEQFELSGITQADERSRPSPMTCRWMLRYVEPLYVWLQREDTDDALDDFVRLAALIIKGAAAAVEAAMIDRDYERLVIMRDRLRDVVTVAEEVREPLGIGDDVDRVLVPLEASPSPQGRP
jgi:hypothetical protein